MPRVTPEDVEANIAEEYYFTAEQGAFAAATAPKGSDVVNPSLSLLTFCVLVLRNGFTVVGHSACASPENFDAELAKKNCRNYICLAVIYLCYCYTGLAQSTISTTGM
jgi:hypothetical protein